ncbi:MAG: 3-deoxy-D-manno-octulosonic acid kinase [Methylococcales bacterium]|nr:3-deoxy-D-manno-octulosonic acid kinase [Methylococcales bacterium]
MALDRQYKIKKIDNSYILYDIDIISDPVLELFDRDYHSNNEQFLPSDLSGETGIGRAKVIYFHSDNKNMVLKHYFRGGLVASIVKDQYFGFDTEKTRAFREWRLLKDMQKLGLPVPNAIAAHVKRGVLYYRADLITQKIENSKTLADILMEKSIDTIQWKKIGSCIKKFHDNNIYHADLNARNILLTEVGDVYLIDFDNSDFRADSRSWKMANLARLNRSLLKFKKGEDDFNFVEEDWSDFLEGYNG